MAHPRRPGQRSGSNNLARQLDREVFASIQSYLDNLEDRQQLDDAAVNVSAVYHHIKRSNSSLARKPKNALEDSIERVLDALKDELSSDSDSAVEMASRQATSTSDGNAGDAMNRRMVQSWNLGENGGRSGSNAPESAATSNAAMSNGNGESANANKRAASSQSLKVNGTTPHSGKRPRRPNTAADTQSLLPPTHIRFADLGGMYDIIEKLQELVLLPLTRPERYMNLGLKMPRGILLHGPPGCGKTMLCQAIAGEMELPFLSISAPSIVSGMSGESEKALRSHFERAVEVAPCLMFIDEIDAITPKRESAQREMERRIVAQLLTCMDDLDVDKTGGKPVIVLAATNRPDSLDPALRRAGRFDNEINIGVPDAKMRVHVLQALTRKTTLADDVNFEEIAQKTPGFVGADLESLVFRAGSVGNRRYIKALQALSEQQTQNTDVTMTNDDQGKASSSTVHPTIQRFKHLKALLDQPQPEAPVDPITHADFLTALPLVQPSALREGFTTVPTTSFHDIGALTEHRDTLKRNIINPIKYPARFEKFGLKSPQGVLLYGPPGCGKSLLARAVARESGANFISVKGPELMNKYVGESERAVRTLFSRARHSQPVVVFFDELDALTPRRSGGDAAAETGGSSLSESSIRVVNTLLTELDSSDRSTINSVHVIAASNRPEAIDPAVLRAGRLGCHLFVGLPSPQERGEILATLLRDKPIEESERVKCVEWAAGKGGCEGFSGADLEGLCREAAQVAIEREGETLVLADLQMAVRRGVKASVGRDEVNRWKNLRLA